MDWRFWVIGVGGILLYVAVVLGSIVMAVSIALIVLQSMGVLN